MPDSAEGHPRANIGSSENSRRTGFCFVAEIQGVGILSILLGIASAWLGFLVVFIAFSAIFIAIKQYRDETLGGVIRFGTAFLIGAGITLVASVVYVAVWEIYLVATDYAFVDEYVQMMIESSEGSAAEVRDAMRADAESIRQDYMNPFFRIPITFVEIFPVGIIVSLVSAYLLKDSKRLAAA